MVKYCRNCGKELEEESVFCDECGTPTDSDANDSFSAYNNTNNPFNTYKIKQAEAIADAISD